MILAFIHRPEHMLSNREIFDVSAFLDDARVGRGQILVAVLAGLLFMVDGFDTAVIGTIAPTLLHEMRITRQELGIVFSTGVVGLMVGYVLIAPLSTRCGQRPVIILSTAAFGILSFTTVFVHDVTTLAVLRFCTGTFLGAALPGAVALTGEYAPKRLRATIITYMGLGMSLGLSAAGFITALFQGSVGWRGVMMFAGILPVFVATLLFFCLPESLHFLVATGGKRILILRIINKMGGRRALSPDCEFSISTFGTRSFRGLFTENRTGGTIALWVAVFMNLMVNAFLQSWLPTIFIDIGNSPQHALNMASISMSGGLVAGFVAGPLMDRHGPYKVMCGLFICGALSFAFTGISVYMDTTFVLTGAFAMCLFNSGAQKSIGALGVFFYPPALRSSGLGWGYGVGRIGAILGPLGIGYLMHAHWSTYALLYLAAAPMGAGAVAMYFMYRRYDKPGSTPPQPPREANLKQGTPEPGGIQPVITSPYDVHQFGEP
jgi:MFS transporter, AAHS family, 4-hydroxybenzoate transporter